MVRPCFSCHCRHFLCWRMKHFYFWSGVWALHPRQFGLIYGLLNFLSENWLQRRLASFFFFLPPFSLSIRGAGWLVGWFGVTTLWLKHFRRMGVDGLMFVACEPLWQPASFSYITHVAVGLNRLVGFTAPSRLFQRNVGQPLITWLLTTWTPRGKRHVRSMLSHVCWEWCSSVVQRL